MGSTARVDDKMKLPHSGLHIDFNPGTGHSAEQPRCSSMRADTYLMQVGLLVVAQHDAVHHALLLLPPAAKVL